MKKDKKVSSKTSPIKYKLIKLGQLYFTCENIDNGSVRFGNRRNAMHFESSATRGCKDLELTLIDHNVFSYDDPFGNAIDITEVKQDIVNSFDLPSRLVQIVSVKAKKSK